jgi:hypothetical protein
MVNSKFLKNGYPEPAGLRQRHMNSVLRGYNWGFAQSYFLSRFVQYAQRSQTIRFRLRKMRWRLLWAYTLCRSIRCAFAKRLAHAAAWSRDPAVPAAVFRRGSAGDCPGATANLSDFAKVPILVWCKTLEILLFFAKISRFSGIVNCGLAAV